VAAYRKRGRTWRAEVKTGGVRESNTFDTKASAVAWATQRESEILAGKRGQIVARTVRQAMERYAEHVSPKHKGERWEKVRLTKLARTVPFAGRWLTEVSRADVAEWRDGMTLAPASARREYGLLRAVFAVAVREWHWLHESPFDHVSPPPEGKPRTRRVSDDELDRLLLALNYERGNRPETASQFIACASLLALETAMRQGEILSLTRADVNAPARFLRLTKTKNGDDRDVPLSRAALALLDLLPDDGSLFLVAARTFDTLFRRARGRAGLADLHFHDLRREATTRLARKLDVLTLAKMTGHRDPKVLLRTYYAPDATDVASRLD
jgi:integrase